MTDKQAGSQDETKTAGAQGGGISTRREAPQAGEGYEMPPEDRAGSPQQHVEGAGEGAGEGLSQFRKD